ncbi:MAG: SDR family NAD(P)-dependent oxidoreductase [Candidatus Marsarchaeota archaeon]|nr:SDR family NAD(P)-dependent oxidoreductase [Candidatus Marsarchaeota archaeon]
MDFTRRSVLVTGAGGFIGSHLAERLAALGARTRALVRYNSLNSWGWLEGSSAKDSIEVILGDVRDSDTVRDAMRGVDTVFHLAALIAIPYSYRAPLSYVRTNVEGTLNVLHEALIADVAMVVHTSTSEVYGTAQYVPIDEKHPLQGQSPYSASKIAADKMAEAFHLSYGLPVTTVRPFNCYGPRQSARAIIPTIISQALKEPALRLGNLKPTRDLNFVSDTVEGFVLAADCQGAVGEVLNLGTGREISIKELAGTILRLLGKDMSIESEDERERPKNSEVYRLCADSRKAREILSWQPGHTLEQGLLKTIAWIESNIDLYKSEAYVI